MSEDSQISNEVKKSEEKKSFLKKLEEAIFGFIRKFRWPILFLGMAIIFTPYYYENTFQEGIPNLLFYGLIKIDSTKTITTIGAILVGLTFPGGMLGRLTLFIGVIGLILWNYLYPLPDISWGFLNFQTSQIVTNIGIFLMGATGVTFVIMGKNK